MHKTRIIICALAIAVALGVGARAAQFSDYLPADSLLYLSWDLTGQTLKDYGQSQLFKMIEDSEFQKLFEDSPKKSIDNMGLSDEEVRKLMRGRMAFAITELEAPKEQGDEPTPHLALFIDTTDPAIKAITIKMQAMLEKKRVEKKLPAKSKTWNGVKIRVYHDSDLEIQDIMLFSYKNNFVIVSTPKAARSIIDAMVKGQPKALTGKTNFVAAQKKAAAKSILWGYFAVDVFKKTMPIDEMLEEDPGSAMIARFLGVNDIHTVAFSVASDSDRLALDFHLLGLKSNAPLMKIMAPRAATAKCLEVLSKDFGGYFVVTSLDIDKLWAELQKFDGSDGGVNLVELIKEIEQEGKFSFKQDIVPNLIGDVLYFNGGEKYEFLMVMTIKNQAGLEKALTALFAMDGSKCVKTKYKNATLIEVQGSGFLALTNDFLVLADTKKTVTKTLDNLASGKPSIKTNEEFKKINELIGGKASTLARIAVNEFMENIGCLVFPRHGEKPLKESYKEEEEWDEDDDWDEEDNWDEEDEDDLLADKQRTDTMDMEQLLKQVIERVEKTLEELKKLREQIKEAGGDTTEIDEKIAELEKELAHLRAQGGPDTPKTPDQPHKDDDNGNLVKPTDIAAIINKYFKNVYAAIVPDKDCLTIKIILR